MSLQSAKFLLKGTSLQLLLSLHMPFLHLYSFFSVCMLHDGGLSWSHAVAHMEVRGHCGVSSLLLSLHGIWDQTQISKLVW